MDKPGPKKKKKRGKPVVLFQRLNKLDQISYAFCQKWYFRWLQIMIVAALLLGTILNLTVNFHCMSLNLNWIYYNTGCWIGIWINM